MTSILIATALLECVLLFVVRYKGVLGRDSAADKRQQRREHLRWYFSQNAKHLGNSSAKKNDG